MGFENEENEQKIKNAFARVKEDISNLGAQISTLFNEISEIKKILSDILLKCNMKQDSLGQKRQGYNHYNGLSKRFLS